MGRNNIKNEKGAATFLDVLGWKGIWERNQYAIIKLQSFVKQMQKKAQEISEKYMDSPDLRGKTKPTEVISISDTVAVFTAASPQIAISIHAELCSWALAYSLEQELPLRGAISYGEYSIADNIMLGYAVDEAASWHETTDWIGVILTPSAKMYLRDELPEFVTTYESIPFKKSMKTLNLCVKWDFEDDKRVYDIIQKKGPHVPDIAPKYLNTLQFLNREMEC